MTARRGAGRSAGAALAAATLPPLSCSAMPAHACRGVLHAAERACCVAAAVMSDPRGRRRSRVGTRRARVAAGGPIDFLNQRCAIANAIRYANEVVLPFSITVQARCSPRCADALQLASNLPAWRALFAKAAQDRGCVASAVTASPPTPEPTLQSWARAVDHMIIRLHISTPHPCSFRGRLIPRTRMQTPQARQRRTQTADRCTQEATPGRAAPGYVLTRSGRWSR